MPSAAANIALGGWMANAGWYPASPTWGYLGSGCMYDVQVLFCVTTAVAAARTMPALVRYYEWFHTCGLEIARHRGFGQTASKAYGLWRAPKLSVPDFTAAGVTFLGALVGACAVPLQWQAARAALLATSLAAYFLYFSQMYCEAHVGAHVTVLIPPALVVLAASPATDPSLDPEVATRAAAFSALLMKIVILTAYCGAGVSKLHSSIKQGRCWFAGPTMQACIFEALFMSTPRTADSFGVPAPFCHAIQRFVVQYPRLLCAPLAFGAVAFETLAPLALLLPPNPCSLLFAVSGIGFHYGICVMQNIDFVSWWGPAYAFFILDPAAAIASGTGVECSASDAFAAAYNASPMGTALASAYVAAHVLACLLLRFFPTVEILPFSAFMMYSDTKDLFDPNLRATVYFTDKPHATGTLKNYCFPFCRPMTVTREELPKLGFKYLALRHGGPNGEEPEVMTNVTVTRELQAALDVYRRMTTAAEQSERAAAAAEGDARRARKLTAALDAARAAFHAAPHATLELAASPGHFSIHHTGKRFAN